MGSFYQYLWSTYIQWFVIVVAILLVFREWHEKKTGQLVVVIVIAALIWFFGEYPAQVLNFISNNIISRVFK